MAEYKFMKIPCDPKSRKTVVVEGPWHRLFTGLVKGQRMTSENNVTPDLSTIESSLRDLASKCGRYHSLARAYEDDETRRKSPLGIFWHGLVQEETDEMNDLRKNEIAPLLEDLSAACYELAEENPKDQKAYVKMGDTYKNTSKKMNRWKISTFNTYDITFMKYYN